MEPLFVDLAKFIDAQTAEAHANGDGSSSKKRKLDSSQGTENQGISFLHEDWNTKTCSSINELSFSIPQRKKLTLEIGSLKSQGVRARNPSTGAVEFGVSYQDIRKRPHLLNFNHTLNPSFLLDHVICLPVPEKAQAQYNFCLFPLHSEGVTVPSQKTSAAEPMLWTAGVGITDGDETYKELCVRLLNESLRHVGQKVLEPDEKEFVSQESRPYKTGEKAVHVKAFRGSKDGISSTKDFPGLDTTDLGRPGFLYFLSNGIAWVFKKPLAFFGFDSVVSVSYTSVLQRTFNLNIVARTSTTSDDTQEFEFSMVDQSNFDGIDAYIKRHRLQDASMADQRRAKRLGINDARGENGTHSAAEEEIGHLEKAAREAEELEDEDSEEDENFDPGSEGESEGSGSSSNEEEEDYHDADTEDGRGDSDLVQEELGSEAEDIDED